MIEGVKPYAEYKESGQKWLGQVPGHWSMRRLRASISDCANGVWGSDPNGKDDLICVRVADFDRVSHRVSLKKKTLRAIPLSARSRRLLRNGDLLLEKSGGGDLQPVGAVVSYDHDDPAVCSNFVARMPLADGYDSHFAVSLHFTLYASRINVLSIKQTTGIQNLDSKAYLREVVAFPPPDEQAAIVRFLDHANRKIDGFIRAKRKLIGLLNEQKQAIIHRAVTRGLHPDIPLKPSGIPWLGDIPKHWEQHSLWTLTKLRTDRNPGNLQLLSVFLDRGVIRYAEGGGQVHAPSLDLSNYQVAMPGDFVLNNQQAWRGSVGVSFHQGIISPAYIVLKLSPKLDPTFTNYLMRSRAMVDQFVAASKGVGDIQRQVFWPFLRMVHVPVPNMKEQRQIVEFLTNETRSLNTAIARTEREIALMQEYRTRLTADLVTGKLDVREAARRLPDEAPLDTVEDDTDLSDETEAADEEAAV